MIPRLMLCAVLLTAGLRGEAGAANAAGGPRRHARIPKSERTRTLDDVRIEGEIEVPQVLFITARDQQRFLDFQYRRYLQTSREIGESTVLPSRITVIQAPTQDARKEIVR